MSANKSWLLYALGLAAVAVLCFGHLASHPFDLDDEFYLADSTRSLDNWAYFFSADKHFAGRPVSEFALLVGYFIAGSDPAFLHGLAVAGHLLASLLLALACASLGAGRELSWTAGMLFLVGVAHFHAVFWISAIAYPIAFALSALALIGYTRLAATGDHRWLALHYAAALAGALAHIAAIAVWPFCLLLAWQRDRHLIPHLLPLGALLVAAAVWATLAYPHTAQVDQASRIPAPLDVGWVALWLWSRLLSTAHWLPLTIYAFADWELGLGILTVVLCALPAWRGEIRPLAWLLCATLPFLTTSPDFLRGIFSGPSRYLYFASASTAVLTALWLQWLAAHYGRPLATATLLALCASSAFALRQAEYTTFYSAGCNYLIQGPTEASRQWLERTAGAPAHIVPLEDVYYHLANIALTQNQDPTPLLKEGLQRVPDAPALLIFQGILEIETPEPGSYQRGLDRLHALWERYDDPGQRTAITMNAATIYANIGNHFLKQEQPAKALQAFEKSLTYAPDRNTTLIALGKAAITARQYDQAVTATLRAAALYPDDAQAHYLAAIAQYRAGDRASAIASGLRAQQLAPDIVLSFLKDIESPGRDIQSPE